MNIVFVLDEKAVDEIAQGMTEDYPILRSLSWGEREEIYQIVQMRLRTMWQWEVADVLERFAVELEDRERRPSRGGQ